MCQRKEGESRIKAILQGLRLSGKDDDSAIDRKNEVREDAVLEEEEREFDFKNTVLEWYTGYQVKT